MQDFVREKNIERYRELLALAENDPARDEARYQMLRRLLTEEKARQQKTLDK